MSIRKEIYFLILLVFVLCLSGIASANSLYVISDLGENIGIDTTIKSYNIQPSPSYLVYQKEATALQYGGVGIAVDSDSETLFVTYEFSDRVQIIDSKNLSVLGQVFITNVTGSTGLAGIVVDQPKQKVYVVERSNNRLHVFSWDATTKNLFYDGVWELPGVLAAHGIAFDEIHKLLYVGDLTKNVKFFNTDDWSAAGNFNVSQYAAGIAVDAKNALVYTGFPQSSETTSLLSKYNLNTNVETAINIRNLTNVNDDNVVGLAVDPDTSLLYITTGYQQSGGSDKIMVFDSNLNLLYATGDIGDPTGLVISGKYIAYNPLNLNKEEGIAEDDCVNPGKTITYEICYDNTEKAYDVSEVVVKDNLPNETSFLLATGNAVYDAFTHTVTWDIGTLKAGAEKQCVKLTVKVDTAPCPIQTKITNYATIDSEETSLTTISETTNICSCEDDDNDSVCNEDDRCPCSRQGEDVDENGCDPFQFCEPFYCGLDCYYADWKNNEAEEYPHDCTVVIVLREGEYYPKCVPLTCTD